MTFKRLGDHWRLLRPDGRGRLFLILCIILCMPLAGCATTMNGRYQLVHVSSSPPGAAVLVDGANLGTTPMTVPLRRKQTEVTIRLEKEGYEYSEVRLRRTFSRWIAGDFGWGGLSMVFSNGPEPVGAGVRMAVGLINIGFLLGVDYLLGGAHKLTPGEVNLELQPSPGIAVADESP